jgi:hypothetical protein
LRQGYFDCVNTGQYWRFLTTVNFDLKQSAQSAYQTGASRTDAENTCPALATESHGAKNDGLDGNTATKFRKALSPPSAEQSKDFHTVLAYDLTAASFAA